MKKFELSGKKRRKATRNRLLMNFDPLIQEVGSAAVIANLLDAIYWGRFFKLPVEISIISKKKTCSVKIKPGEFLIEQIIGAEIPVDLGNHGSLSDWLTNYYDFRDPESAKLYKFRAISPVIYCSTWFRWEFDTSRESIIQEYLDGLPVAAPKRNPRNQSSIPTTLFKFELSEDVFAETQISLERVMRVFEEFKADSAIPHGVNIYPQAISSTEFKILLK